MKALTINVGLVQVLFFWGGGGGGNLECQVLDIDPVLMKVGPRLKSVYNL